VYYPEADASRTPVRRSGRQTSLEHADAKEDGRIDSPDDKTGRDMSPTSPYMHDSRIHSSMIVDPGSLGREQAFVSYRHAGDGKPLDIQLQRIKDASKQAKARAREFASEVNGCKKAIDELREQLDGIHAESNSHASQPSDAAAGQRTPRAEADVKEQESPGLEKAQTMASEASSEAEDKDAKADAQVDRERDATDCKATSSRQRNAGDTQDNQGDVDSKSRVQGEGRETQTELSYAQSQELERGQLADELKAAKKQYRRAYQDLQHAKEEVQSLHSQKEATTKALLDGFEEWYCGRSRAESKP